MGPNSGLKPHRIGSRQTGWIAQSNHALVISKWSVFLRPQRINKKGGAVPRWRDSPSGFGMCEMAR